MPGYSMKPKKKKPAAKPKRGQRAATNKKNKMKVRSGY